MGIKSMHNIADSESNLQVKQTLGTQQTSKIRFRLISRL